MQKFFDLVLTEKIVNLWLLYICNSFFKPNNLFFTTSTTSLQTPSWGSTGVYIIYAPSFPHYIIVFSNSIKTILFMLYYYCYQAFYLFILMSLYNLVFQSLKNFLGVEVLIYSFKLKFLLSVFFYSCVIYMCYFGKFPFFLQKLPKLFICLILFWIEHFLFVWRKLNFQAFLNIVCIKCMSLSILTILV